MMTILTIHADILRRLFMTYQKAVSALYGHTSRKPCRTTETPVWVETTFADSGNGIRVASSAQLSLGQAFGSNVQ